VAYRMEDGSIVYAPEAREVSLQRRVLLGCGLGTVGALAGCAVSAPASPDRITAPASGEPMARTALLDLMRNGDYVLLGEHHDNTDHHRLRAELLAALPAPVAVVVEHLPRGAAPLLSRNQRGSALLLALQEAGFDARGWRWPLHEPLFTAIAAGGHRLLGGNLPRELARRTAREGAEALPAELRAAIDAAPLAAGARATLVDDLVSGHCGNLPPERTPSMVLAQRGRDAAMRAAAARADACCCSPATATCGETTAWPSCCRACSPERACCRSASSNPAALHHPAPSTSPGRRRPWTGLIPAKLLRSPSPAHSPVRR
jgi:hypothetical protein